MKVKYEFDKRDTKQGDITLCTRLVLEEGELRHESLVVEGGKIQLNDIWKCVLQKLKKYMCLNNGEFFDDLKVMKKKLTNLGELESSL